MNILITGAAGQLGTEIRTQLREGKSVLGALPAAYTDAQVFEADVPEVDITNPASLRTCFERARPDIVINCAAYTNVDGCETDKDAAWAVNADGPELLAQLVQEYGAKLVHVSTDYVFEGVGSTPYKETDAPNPQSVYGSSKLAGEQRVAEQCAHHFIVRTAWLYGTAGKNFVKTITNAAQAGKELRVVDDQVGCPTNATDLAHQLLLLAVTDSYGTYHCVNAGQCSWFEFATQIVANAGIDALVNPCSSAEYPTPARRPVYSVLDCTKIEAVTNESMRTWFDALDDYCHSTR
ncbi:MAG: dTDP-4-dehydrorhamnose reductase [Coriobacteriia bacterium]|nr:dTDP-4-dehydrorhamnose reductase [Coriobacteriia bacterium]